MDTHVRVLAILQIVLGAMGILAGLIILLVFGGVASIVGTVGTMENEEALIAVPIIGIVGTVILVLVLVMSAPLLIAGFGLMSYKTWARILTIVLCVLNLPCVPIGTAVGVYGLWVMLSGETERLFQQGGPPGPAAWNQNRAG